MSERRGQQLQPSKRELMPLPKTLENYQELYRVFYLNKKRYNEDFTGKQRTENLEDYAKMCSEFLSLIIKYDKDWKWIKKNIIIDIRRKRVVLDQRTIQFDEKAQQKREGIITDGVMIEASTKLARCFEDAERIAEELYKDSLHVHIPSRSGQEGPLHVDKSLKPVGFSAQRGRPEHIDPEDFRLLKEDWIKCVTTAKLCKQIISKLQRISRSDEKFVKKSLKEINEGVILDLCDELGSFLSSLQGSPIGKELPCDLPTFLLEVDNLRKHVQDFDVNGMHDCFSRIWIYVIKLRNFDTILQIIRISFGNSDRRLPR